jgi:hypothetical protein
MSRTLRAGTAGLLAAGALAAAAPAASATETLVTSSNADPRGTTVNVLDASRPESTRVLRVVGAAAGDRLVGLDVRPATRTLYGLGDNGDTGQDYIVQLNFDVKPAGFDGTAFVSPVGARYDTQGGQFGFDFNPTVDRIRVVSDFEQNLRLNPDTGAAIVDGELRYAATDPNAGADPEESHVAYTPAPFGGMTTLYGIAVNQDVLVTQNPANAGTLNTIGSLGVEVGRIGGFDIGRSVSGPGTVAYAALREAGESGSSLFRVDLGTGRLTRLGAIPGPRSESLAILPAGLVDSAR